MQLHKLRRRIHGSDKVLYACPLPNCRMAVTGKVFLKVKLEKHWKVHLDNGHISSDAILEFNQARLPRFFRSPLSDAIFTYQRRNDVGRTVASDIADSDDIEQQAINGDGDYSMEDHFIQDGLTDDDSEDDDLEEEGGDPFPQGRIDILKENEKDWGMCCIEPLNYSCYTQRLTIIDLLQIEMFRDCLALSLCSRGYTCIGLCGVLLMRIVSDGLLLIYNATWRCSLSIEQRLSSIANGIRATYVCGRLLS
jgi:hypothetical protein